jgi:hypothetical protein
MNETLQKAENYLHRAEQGWYTEIGEGDSLLRKLVNEVKAFFSQDENPLPPVEEPTTGDEANDPVLPPTPDAPVGTEGPEGEIPAETSETASVAPEANQEDPTQEPVAEATPESETSTAQDEAPKA